MLSKWLVGQGWNSVFHETSSLYDIVFWNFFHKNFCELKISDGDACWSKWWYARFVRAVLFHFRKFRTILIKMKRLQSFTDRKTGFWSKWEAELPVPIFANKFWKTTFTPLMSISTGNEKNKAYVPNWPK